MPTTRQTPTSPTASNALWPIAAVLPVVPLTALPPGVADWVATALVIAALVGALWLLDVRDWRDLRRRPPLAVRDRGDPDRERVAAAHAARRGHVALSRPRGDRRHRARLRRSRSSCSSGPSRVAGARRPAQGGGRRRRHGRGVAPPAPAVHEHRRLRPPPAEPRPDVRARRVHAVRAAHGPRRPRHRRARDHGRARSGRARPRVAPSQPGARARGRARPVADRVASLLRPADRPARAVASTIRRRVADSHRPLGRRRHAQRRPVADRLRARPRHTDVRAVRMASANRPASRRSRRCAPLPRCRR